MLRATCRLLRASPHEVYVQSVCASTSTTVLRSTRDVSEGAPLGGPPSPGAAPTSSPPSSPPPPPPRRSWALGAAAIALTAGLGGVYFYKKLNDTKDKSEQTEPATEAPPVEDWVSPPSGSAFPPRVRHLVVGGGTAGASALRTLRALEPQASVLLVSAEPCAPYMRAPLTKELWANALQLLPHQPQAPRTDRIAVTSHSGRTRRLSYEPLVFYSPLEALHEGGGGALARGWRVSSLNIGQRKATLEAPNRPPVTLEYDTCLLATGTRPVPHPKLTHLAHAGLSQHLSSAGDAVQLAGRLQELQAQGKRPRVAIVGQSARAKEMAYTLAQYASWSSSEAEAAETAGAQLKRGLADVLLVSGGQGEDRDPVPPSLLQGTEPLQGELVSAEPTPEGGVRLTLLQEGDLHALDVDVVLDMWRMEVDTSVASEAGLPCSDCGVSTSVDLRVAPGVWAAGDAACVAPVAHGTHGAHAGASKGHDHAVSSARTAAKNMVLAAQLPPPAHYDHHALHWADYGPQHSYETIGDVHPSLATYSVFNAADVTGQRHKAVAEAGAEAEAGQEAGRIFRRGVVFFLQEKRVVGVLLWNLFNRTQLARQVVERGEFEDLFEVAKLFNLHEE